MQQTKTLIKNIAELLIHANGNTSTLEVKNYLYQTTAGCTITQREVSDTMTELFREDEFNRNLVSENGFDFFRYTLKNPVNIPKQQVNYPKGFGMLAVNNGNFVCYVSGKPNLFVQGQDRKTARKECFKKFKDQGITWDNINTCSLKYYNKNLA